jgi:hypothetical protein
MLFGVDLLIIQDGWLIVLEMDYFQFFMYGGWELHKEFSRVDYDDWKA